MRDSNAFFLIKCTCSSHFLIFQQLSTLHMTWLFVCLMPLALASCLLPSLLSSLRFFSSCVYKCTYLLQLFSSICVNGWQRREVKFSCKDLTEQTKLPLQTLGRKSKSKSKVTNLPSLKYSKCNCVQVKCKLFTLTQATTLALRVSCTLG